MISVAGCAGLLHILTAATAPNAPGSPKARVGDAVGRPVPLVWEAPDSDAWWGAVALAGAGIAAAALATVLPHRGEPPQGGYLFDDAAGRVLRAPTESGRAAARRTSDALAIAAVTYPVLIDAAVVSAWHRRSPQAGRQMALMAAQVYAVTVGITTLTKRLVGRERPYGADCGRTIDADSRACHPDTRTASFPSGHTSWAFAGAAVTCSLHRQLLLYGGGVADALPCAIATTAATLTGVMRVVGDRHYLTDVVAGAALGTATGLLLPWLFHARNRPSARAHEIDRSSRPVTRRRWTLLPALMGLQLIGEL